MDPKEQRKHEITRLCDQHGCSEKIRKIHFEQFTRTHPWHPHPTKDFSDWWSTHPDFLHAGIDAKRAFNCQSYVNQFFDARQIGAA